MSDGSHQHHTCLRNLEETKNKCDSRGLMSEKRNKWILTEERDRHKQRKEEGCKDNRKGAIRKLERTTKGKLDDKGTERNFKEGR